MKKTTTALLILLMFCACGGSASEFSDDIPTELPPIVSRVEPLEGPSGTEIKIYGFGFSVNIPVNVVLIGGQAESAVNYELLPDPTDTEIEMLTASVPEGAAEGPSPVVVIVYENVSNQDVVFNVTP